MTVLVDRVVLVAAEVVEAKHGVGKNDICRCASTLKLK
jgi:hypothetical protein